MTSMRWRRITSISSRSGSTRFTAKSRKWRRQPNAAIIDEAHKNRLRVAAHEYKLDDAKQLVEDGIDVLAHSVRDQAVDTALVQSMLQHHTWYIPTLALDEAFYVCTTHPDFMQTNFFKQAAGPQLLAKLKGPASPQAAQSQQDEAMGRRNVTTLYDAGVQIAFGTDSGASPGRFPASRNTANSKTWFRPD